VAREQGVSKHTIHASKAKYGGREVSEAEEVKHLRDENARLKKLVADLSLDKDMLQSVIRKNSLNSSARRAKVRRLLEEFAASERHVCELMAVPRSRGRYRSRRDDRKFQRTPA
jgi:putative transposase